MHSKEISLPKMILFDYGQTLVNEPYRCNLWYIRDNYGCDVVGARNAGIFSVWYVGRRMLRMQKKKMC